MVQISSHVSTPPLPIKAVYKVWKMACTLADGRQAVLETCRILTGTFFAYSALTLSVKAGLPANDLALLCLLFSDSMTQGDRWIC